MISNKNSSAYKTTIYYTYNICIVIYITKNTLVLNTYLTKLNNQSHPPSKKILQIWFWSLSTLAQSAARVLNWTVSTGLDLVAQLVQIKINLINFSNANISVVIVYITGSIMISLTPYVYTFSFTLSFGIITFEIIICRPRDVHCSIIYGKCQTRA